MKNTSGAPIHGPVYVFVENLPVGATLAEAAGALGRVPYLRVTSGDLAAGATASTSIRVKMTASAAFHFTTRVIAGSL